MAKGTCSVDDCDRPQYARGWCNMHWTRWCAHGDPLVVKKIMGDLRARMESHVDREVAAPCWMWTSTVDKTTGYGRIHVGTRTTKKLRLAHRLFYEEYVGPIPDGFTVDHQCHNDDASCLGGICRHRRCVNPDHMVLRRMRGNLMESGRTPAALNVAKTHCPQGHPYAGENLYVSPRGRRSCRQCARDRWRRSR